MKTLHHSAPNDNPFIVGMAAPELPLTASLLRHRLGVSVALARLIHREHYGECGE